MVIEHITYRKQLMRAALSFALYWGVFAYALADMAPVLEPPHEPSKALQLPEGFQLNVFAQLQGAGADYFRGPRMMAFGPDGHLYVSTGMDNKVWMLVDSDQDGAADKTVLVSDQLNAPQGLVFVDGHLFVANQNSVVRLERNDSGQWPAGKIIPIITGLATGGHTLKALKLGPDDHLYLNVGSSCNVCAESDPTRATIKRYTKDGVAAGALVTLGRHKPSATWAKGLRNAQGFAWHPATGKMYATNNGSDMRAASQNGPIDDDLPPEHLNRIEAHGHYGWPYCWGNQVADPLFGNDAEFCKKTIAPAIMFEAHSTPIGISFLANAIVPEHYKTDAIVALHGSWNREKPNGHKLVRVVFKDHEPAQVLDFATGWLTAAGAWGRPVDVLVGPDGAIYVTDDRSGLIYRIQYTGEGKRRG